MSDLKTTKYNKLLIIGKTPPPIGGVTIHTSRLLSSLEKDEINFHYLNLNLINLLLMPVLMIKYSCVHIHSSSPLVRFYIMLICKIYSKYGVVTIHGDLNRFKLKIKNWIDKKTIQISDKPITLNEISLQIAKNINIHSEMVSSFIPPDVSEEYLPSTSIKNINNMRNKYDILFCTNAYNLTYDKDGKEIYGINELIEFFRIYSNLGLVFSDPSSAYINEFKKRNLIIPENIYIINGNHSFYKVMELSDASIRNTTTDGDSISIKESLYLNKITFATDVVSRPAGCITYKKGYLEKIIEYFDHNHNYKDFQNKVDNGYYKLKEIYQSCMVVK